MQPNQEANVPASADGDDVDVTNNSAVTGFYGMWIDNQGPEQHTINAGVNQNWAIGANQAVVIRNVGPPPIDVSW